MAEDVCLSTQHQDTLKSNSKPSSQLKKRSMQSKDVNKRQGTKESQSKNVNSTTDHHSRQEAHKTVHKTKDRLADSLELEATIKMEEQNEVFGP